MSHADEVITDVNTRRLFARAEGDHFTLGWDYPGRTLLEVRVLRSNQCVAASADDVEEGQDLAYQGVTGSFCDLGLLPDRPYYYTVFARGSGGEWVRWGEYSVPCGAGRGRGVLARLVSGGSRAGALRGLLGLVVLACATMLLAVGFPGVALASGEDGDKVKEPSGSEAAIAVARADPDVAAVLEDRAVTPLATAWSEGADPPAGYTVVFRWPASSRASISAVWPLLHTGIDAPRLPYDTAAYRLRVDGLTALRVDVLSEGGRVLQIMPVDGETRFTLQEQTWAPFSWFPWLTQRPWVLAPVFIGLALLSILRAWQRSRAWNRPTPSMTRHDRQLIGRVGMLLFLLLGFLWQCYEGWYAATGPSIESSGASAGDLASLPLLLIPPGLFVAALVFELSAAPHRGAWGLIAFLCGAVSVFNLATALTGTVTNLNLSYFILLAVLALVAVPRAFSISKMGWSRSYQPRYG